MYKSNRAARLESCLTLLTEYGILTTVFFLPLSLDASTICLLAAGFGWACRAAVRRRVYWRPGWLDAPAALLVLFSAASVFASPDPAFSYYNFSHLMGRYMLLYYLVAHNARSPGLVEKIVAALLASALLVIAYGFYQFAQGIDISGREWVDSARFPELKTRVYSTLQNPNLLAGYLAMLLSFTFGLFCRARRGGVQAALAVFMVAMAVCLAMTYSRGAWISAAAVIGLYALCCRRKYLWLCLLAAAAVFLVGGVADRLASIADPEDTSAVMRLALWRSTLAMIADHPLRGVGWGAYWMAYPAYDFVVRDAGVRIVHAHNMYLNFAAEIGLPGLAAFLGVLAGHFAAALSGLQRTGRACGQGVLLGGALALLSAALNGVTDYVLFNIELSMLFWLLNALIVATLRAGNKNGFP